MTQIHKTWNYLKPNNNEKYENFRFEEYYERVMKSNRFHHIPKVVFDQWIYYLHQDPETLRNYAWLDYENIEFNLCEWNYIELEKVYVIEDFKPYYEDRSKYTDFDQFCCNHEDLNHWKEFGTWRTPPIILDINSISKELPEWSELKEPFQLVEGHSRLGYLRSMKKISDLNKGKIATRHKIYLMKEKVLIQTND